MHDIIIVYFQHAVKKVSFWGVLIIIIIMMIFYVPIVDFIEKNQNYILFIQENLW